MSNLTSAAPLERVFVCPPTEQHTWFIQFVFVLVLLLLLASVVAQGVYRLFAFGKRERAGLKNTPLGDDLEAQDLRSARSSRAPGLARAVLGYCCCCLLQPSARVGRSRHNSARAALAAVRRNSGSAASNTTASSSAGANGVFHLESTFVNSRPIASAAGGANSAEYPTSHSLALAAERHAQSSKAAALASGAAFLDARSLHSASSRLH